MDCMGSSPAPVTYQPGDFDLDVSPCLSFHIHTVELSTDLSHRIFLKIK